MANRSSVLSNSRPTVTNKSTEREIKVSFFWEPIASSFLLLLLVDYDKNLRVVMALFYFTYSQGNGK